jgi:hypothetical protein
MRGIAQPQGSMLTFISAALRPGQDEFLKPRLKVL